MSAVKLVAIVNSFNRLSLARTALPSLAAALDRLSTSSAIVVFEAGSTDGTREWLTDFAEQCKNVPIHALTPKEGEDTSFSAGLNSACQFAISEFPEMKWFLFFETDNHVEDGSPLDLATKLLDKENELAAVGFTVKKHSGEPAGLGTSFPTPWQFLIGPQLTFRLGLDRPDLADGGKLDDHNWSTCSVVFTSPLLVRREAWDESKGMDAATFPFSDCDLDWCWRLNKLGWKIAVLEIDGVIHDNKEEISAWSEKRAIHFHQARLKLLERHCSKWVHCVKPVLFLRHFFETIALILLSPFRKHALKSIKTRWHLLTSVLNNYK